MPSLRAFQNETRYDSTFFEIVEDSFLLRDGIETSNIAVSTHEREQYVNYLSLSGGTKWNAKTVVGSFQMRVIGKAGASVLRNMDCSVSCPDGSGSYRVTAEDVTVIISDRCTVHFDARGGSSTAAKTVTHGKALARPTDPVREGWRFTG